MTIILNCATFRFMNLVKSRQRKTQDPCVRCRMHKNYCICKDIPNLDVSTYLTLVIHAKELKRTSNTGSLAILALSQSEMIIRGLDHQALDLTKFLKSSHDPVLFYPGPGSLDLKDFLHQRSSSSKDPQKPIQLIVPDGNWRQASKVASRHPEIQSLPRVQITQTNLATHHLRKEHFEEGMSTLEAIACAYELLEGPWVGDKLKELYQLKLRRTLQARGQLF